MSSVAKDIDLLLIGKTGNGKSSTGNSILKRRLFESAADTTSVTKSVQVHYANYNGRTIKVVDGPGVGDTDLSGEDARKQIIEAMTLAIAASHLGYHAFLLVVKFGGRFTKEDKQTIEVLRAVFGEEFVKKCSVLVVTYGDNFDFDEMEYDSFEEWCSNQVGVFHDLVVECGNRVVLFNNRTKDESIINKQLDRLLEVVDGLSAGGQRYTNEHFKMAAERREILMIECKIPIIREETMKEASLIIQELGKVNLDEPERQLIHLDQLLVRADNLVKSVIVQDKSTGALKEIIQNTQHIKEGVEGQIVRTKSFIEIQSKRRQMQEEMEQLRIDKANKEKEQLEFERERDEFRKKTERLEEEERENKKRLEEALSKDVQKVETEHVEASNNSMWSTVMDVGKYVASIVITPVLTALVKKLVQKN